MKMYLVQKKYSVAHWFQYYTENYNTSEEEDFAYYLNNGLHEDSMLDQDDINELWEYWDEDYYHRAIKGGKYSSLKGI